MPHGARRPGRGGACARVLCSLRSVFPVSPAVLSLSHATFPEKPPPFPSVRWARGSCRPGPGAARARARPPARRRDARVRGTASASVAAQIQLPNAADVSRGGWWSRGCGRSMCPSLPRRRTRWPRPARASPPLFRVRRLRVQTPFWRFVTRPSRSAPGGWRRVCPFQCLRPVLCAASSLWVWGGGRGAGGGGADRPRAAPRHTLPSPIPQGLAPSVSVVQRLGRVPGTTDRSMGRGTRLRSAECPGGNGGGGRRGCRAVPLPPPPPPRAPSSSQTRSRRRAGGPRGRPPPPPPEPPAEAPRGRVGSGGPVVIFLLCGPCLRFVGPRQKTKTLDRFSVCRPAD